MYNQKKEYYNLSKWLTCIAIGMGIIFAQLNIAYDDELIFNLIFLVILGIFGFYGLHTTSAELKTLVTFHRATYSEQHNDSDKRWFLHQLSINALIGAAYSGLTFVGAGLSIIFLDTLVKGDFMIKDAIMMALGLGMFSIFFGILTYYYERDFKLTEQCRFINELGKDI